MKHTPGPWNLHAGYVYGENMQKYLIADTFDFMHTNKAAARHSCISPEESEANANLITAAPDLLEAAKALTSGMYAGHVPERKYKQVVALRKAISKATGEGE